jgi:hypothetical protein
MIATTVQRLESPPKPYHPELVQIVDVKKLARANIQSYSKNSV